ncbi:MAG: alpha/beta hydrolase, partial [Thalassolituus sp.]
INTSLANMSLPWERMTAIGFFKLLACAGARLRLERTIFRLTINRDISKNEKDEWLTFAAQHPLRWRNVFVQLFAASRYRGPVTAPIEQVFFYNAAKDRLVRPDCTRRIALRWNKPLLTHPDAGHDLPVDAPDWLEQSIRGNIS